MKSKLYHFGILGCFGITTEIFFTAISDNVAAFSAGEPLDLRLIGHSYIWMFLIYGSAAIFFPLAAGLLKNLPLIARLCIYTLGIFTIEFISGWLLEVFTGSCPWEYTTGMHLCGYIRLDYAPLWMGFGYLLELITSKLSRMDFDQ